MKMNSMYTSLANNKKRLMRGQSSETVKNNAYKSKRSSVEYSSADNSQERSISPDKSIDKQYLNMLNNKEGFGISPTQTSPTKSLAARTSMALVNEHISPTRQAMHKQIGGRIVQENEVKLANTLEANVELQK